MCWIEGILLSSQNEVRLTLDLIGIFATCGVRDAHDLVIDINNKVMLAHQSATYDKRVSVLDIDGDTVAISVLTVKILTGVPIEDVWLIHRTQLKSQDRKRSKVVIRAIRELLNAISEAQVSQSVKLHVTLAVVNRISRTEIL